MSHDAREAEQQLPRAEVTSYPDCGCCGSETSHNGDNLECLPCLLVFDPHTLSASYSDVGAERGPCGNTTATHNHVTSLLTHEWVCRPCPLPEGHASDCYHICSLLPIKR